jgi:hypothetical protein
MKPFDVVLAKLGEPKHSRTEYLFCKSSYLVSRIRVVMGTGYEYNSLLLPGAVNV